MASQSTIVIRFQCIESTILVNESSHIMTQAERCQDLKIYFRQGIKAAFKTGIFAFYTQKTKTSLIDHKWLQVVTSGYSLLSAAKLWS